MANLISLDQKLKRIKINKAEIENEVVFEYFDKLPASEREDKFFQALYIGVLALMEDRISAFLAKTQNELGTELESLKMLFDLKKEIFYKTAVKGMIAEDDLTDFLNEYFKEKKWRDEAKTTGTMEGKLPKNKTGDIVCFVDGDEEKRIIIEAKFDKSMKLGDISDKDIFTKKFDTAWSQIIEAKANREGTVGMIVFDLSLVDNSILKLTDSVAYIHGVGFIVIVDSRKGDYSNLVIAYNLARDIVKNAKEIEFDDKTLTMIIKRIIKDIDTFFSIKKIVESNIDNNKEILKELEKALLLMEFNQSYLEKFLADGKLSNEDMLEFYSGEEVKDKYKKIEEEIAT
ncbi:hypothetical protein GF357_03425 [Candidatus Dojkabacteria bacterium]|nr:hypothetical protein [Candidatus Dojkabacteria bacterium]